MPGCPLCKHAPARLDLARLVNGTSVQQQLLRHLQESCTSRGVTRPATRRAERGRAQIPVLRRAALPLCFALRTVVFPASG
jgi:hypothetical protein